LLIVKGEKEKMKFLSVYTTDPKNGGMGPEAQAEMGKLMAETKKAGTLFLTGGILPVAKGGARVRAIGGRTTMDGPFTETKEIVGGFAILEAKSREDAIGMVERFLEIAGDGECQMQRIMEPGEGQAN
jgi:hypothetical protein